MEESEFSAVVFCIRSGHAGIIQEIPKMLLRHATSKLAFLIVFAWGLAPAAGAQTDKASQSISDMIGALGGKTFLEVREIQATERPFHLKRDALRAATYFSITSSFRIRNAPNTEPTG